MAQPSKLSRRFSFFGFVSASASDSLSPTSTATLPKLDPPLLKLENDRDVYRPGDPITVTILVKNPTDVWSLFIEKLRFECKGIEKLDTQWFSTPKSASDSKHRRGEHVFMDCSSATLVSSQIISSGATKTYVLRTHLPNVIPPSYRGTTIRYQYYIRTVLSGQYLIMENGASQGESVQDFSEQEARIPLQIWVTQKNNGLLGEEGSYDGIVPRSTIFLDVYWKEMNTDSEWSKLNDTLDGDEEGYDSSRDDILSISSINPMKEDIHRNFGSSLSLQSFTARSSTKGSLNLDARANLPSNIAHPQLSVAEVLHGSPDRSLVSPNQPPKQLKSFSADADSRSPSASGSVESGSSEGVVRGRSYNIRLDEEILLRFSPKNSDSTYYFSDMIGGTLTFFHEEGSGRCLEVSVTLEVKESINKRFVHPSRKHSPTITKIHNDHHEVVADLVQTSFLFSIPMDGPMTFSTPYVSVQWALRFEFLTTPKNVDFSRFEHPLLIEGRDKCEWVLPITVHSPPLGAAANQTRNEKSFPLDPLWVHT